MYDLRWSLPNHHRASRHYRQIHNFGTLRFHNLGVEPRYAASWQEPLEAATLTKRRELSWFLLPGFNREEQESRHKTSSSRVLLSFTTYTMRGVSTTEPSTNQGTFSTEPKIKPFIQRVWRRADVRIGYDSRLMRLHGLRRGASTYLASKSETVCQWIKENGHWNSEGT